MVILWAEWVEWVERVFVFFGESLAALAARVHVA